MSCGQPHETDCRDVLAEVYLYLDLECDDSRREKIRVHLDECSPCLREYGIEQEVKALVARCCGNDRAPSGLKERVLVRLRGLGVESDARAMGVESDARAMGVESDARAMGVESEARGYLPE